MPDEIKNNKKTASFYLDVELWDEFVRVCEVMGLSKSEHVERAIRQYLAEYKKTHNII
jgi:metal-responsive CopG/Arc/MetJ family transcriptional regulator